MRCRGTITEWNDARGYGFVTPEDGSRLVFINIKEFMKGQRRPVGNELVSYELTIDSRGRLQGRSVMYVADRHSRFASAPGPGSSGLIFTLGCLALAVTLAVTAPVPAPLTHFYFAACGLAYVAYAVDKVAALSSTRRTPERVLHWISLIGGWPGALLAQITLRHKTKKLSFQMTFWMTVALNVTVSFWAMSSSGQQVTEALSHEVSAMLTSLQTERPDDALPIVQPL